MINISPLSGYTLDTIFTLSYSGLSGSYIVNWGDGVIDNLNTNQHYYTAANIYDIFVTNCNRVSAFQVSAFPNVLYRNTINVSYDVLSAFTSCPQTLTLNISSTEPTATVFLYASGSKASPVVDNDSFWGHLKPNWGFYDANDNKISEISVTCSPVISANILLGYSASSAISYKDDMPGKPWLFFTLKQNEKNILINSRAYAAIRHTVSAIAPNMIKITSDGINPLPPLQWTDYKTPFMTTIANSNISCSTLLHYVSGYLTGVKYYTECNGIPDAKYETFLSKIYPYAIQNFILPTSALPADQIISPEIACGENPYETHTIKTRKYPYQLTVSASGVFNVDGKIYHLTGISDPFNIYKFDNFHQFYRKGEDDNIYNLIKRYSHVDIEQFPTFNSYLSAVAGEGDSLGLIYDKIQNFTPDHSDVDVCTIDSLYNLSQQFDVSMDNFNLDFPEELRRLMNFFSIPLQKLIGTRCKCNTNFVNCQNSCNKNVCTLCGFDKKSNLGKQLALTDNISDGQTVLYRERGSDVFNFLNVKRQTEDTFKLSTLTATPILDKGIENFCFFEWNQTPQNNPVEGIINYNDYRNSLSPALSSYSDWYSDGGVIEEVLNYVLTEKLIDT